MAKAKSNAQTKKQAKTKSKTESKTNAKIKTSAMKSAKMSPKSSAKTKGPGKTQAKSSAKAQKKTASQTTAKKGASAKSMAKPTAMPARNANGKAGGETDWQSFLTPLDDRLIVEMASSEKKTPGGLIIPDTVGDVSGNFKGQVLVAGRGHRDEKGKIHPMDVKPGDFVLFTEYAGSKLNLLGRDVRILRESEVLGIIVK